MIIGSTVFLPWLKNRIEHDQTILSMYHNDFKLLNGKLLHLYDKDQQLFPFLNQKATIANIEEVSEENVLAFKSLFLMICCIPSKICIQTYKYSHLIKSSVM